MKKDVHLKIGTSGWTYDDWRGIFYPEELAKKDWLHYYAKHFNTIELNATFYRFFKKENYSKWHDSVPKNFRFIVKVPRLVTHFKKLNKCNEIIESFCDLTSALNNKLGLYLLQLAPDMPYEPQKLKEVLLAFKNPKQVAVEVRHAKWLTEELKDLLTELSATFCIPDSPQMHLPDWLTSKTAYIRLHGRKKWYDYNYSKKELKEVAQLALQLKNRGAKTIYIALNNDYYAYAIDNANYLITLLEKQT